MFTINIPAEEYHKLRLSANVWMTIWEAAQVPRSPIDLRDLWFGLFTKDEIAVPLLAILETAIEIQPLSGPSWG